MIVYVRSHWALFKPTLLCRILAYPIDCDQSNSIPAQPTQFFPLQSSSRLCCPVPPNSSQVSYIQYWLVLCDLNRPPLPIKTSILDSTPAIRNTQDPHNHILSCLILLMSSWSQSVLLTPGSFPSTTFNPSQSSAILWSLRLSSEICISITCIPNPIHLLYYNVSNCEKTTRCDPILIAHVSYELVLARF